LKVESLFVSVVFLGKRQFNYRLAPGEEAPTQMNVGEAMNRATGERDNRLGGGVVTGSRTKTAPR
jgi:hypothetical protein